MGKMSLRDIAILLAVVVLSLYGLAAVLWFMTFERDWSKSAKAYDAAVKTYRKEANLIARRDELQQQYQEEEEKIPVLGESELANATWMGRLGSIASESNVSARTTARRSRRACSTSSRSTSSGQRLSRASSSSCTR